ncbi:VWA domain-containing protein [Aliikangiella marina]|uniref:VWA domain-containing protein n=1 Tax=Aliikangiella marina TaxID=1712262 RepID=A0A545TIE8_9GAMM|nr:vWA domain-containing protein [Aliikangiella marina]TQV77002.1 VWA domain-containing protein [Aliikangiella marina]
MKILKIVVLFVLSVGISFSTGVALAAEQAEKPDVRLLIDISGSMKQNDPNNLRIPALQLVTNLMPQGADAGVWAFGKYVNMMVKLSPVDEKWQIQATQTANKINSAGLFTNIGGVLERASYGWTRPDASEKRSMILLTDGMVDISKDPAVNAKERERILNQVLPKLVQANVAIHTIALSQNADHDLLKALSSQTDGWYQAVENADDLQRVFLKIFEQSAARDSLPLTDNQFKVDSSIEEMTLLVFKKSSSDKSKLVTPDGAVIQDASADGKVRWFSTQGYDLITVKAPQVGDWRIDADIDPDNRVMVVSNLKLQVSDVPNNLLAGEAIDYQVTLLEDGQPIDRQDFLDLVNAQLIQKKQGSTNRLAMFFDSGKSQFKQNFFTDSFEGVLDLTLEVKSPTFERTRNHAVNIYGSPLIHDVLVSNEESQPHQVSFIVRDDIVKSETLIVNATVTAPDQEKRYLVLDDLNKPIEIPVFPAGGDFSIGLDIKGQSILGREFTVTPEPIVFSTLPTPAYLAAQVPEEPDVEEPVIEEPATDEASDSAEEETQDAAPETEEPVIEEPQEPQTDWTMWLYIGLGINIVLIVLGIFAWKVIKKKKQQGTTQLTDELGIEEDSDE